MKASRLSDIAKKNVLENVLENCHLMMKCSESIYYYSIIDYLFINIFLYNIWYEPPEEKDSGHSHYNRWVRRFALGLHNVYTSFSDQKTNHSKVAPTDYLRGDAEASSSCGNSSCRRSDKTTHAHETDSMKTPVSSRPWWAWGVPDPSPGTGKWRPAVILQFPSNDSGCFSQCRDEQ